MEGDSRRNREWKVRLHMPLLLRRACTHLVQAMLMVRIATLMSVNKLLLADACCVGKCKVVGVKDQG